MSDYDNMHGNERFGDAYFAAERVTSGAEDINDATVATAYATLALAYEQRTANLIAYWTAITDVQNVEELTREGRQEAKRIRDEIFFRLGFATLP